MWKQRRCGRIFRALLLATLASSTVAAPTPKHALRASQHKNRAASAHAEVNSDNNQSPVYLRMESSTLSERRQLQNIERSSKVLDYSRLRLPRRTSNMRPVEVPGGDIVTRYGAPVIGSSIDMVAADDDRQRRHDDDDGWRISVDSRDARVVAKEA